MFMQQYFRDEGPKALPPWYEVQYRFNISVGLANTVTVYMQHGKPHCEDGPAVVSKDRREYYIDGRLHRLDGPAVETTNGFKMWFNKGMLHRTDGPAVECPSGHYEYYVNGKRHRVDGPAILYANGDNAWYEEGVQQSPQYLLNGSTGDMTALSSNTTINTSKLKKDNCSLA